MAKQVVILLHGVGSNGRDLQPLAQYWAQQHPQRLFLTINAPFPFEQGGGGYQWFSINGVTEQSRPARVVAAREHFDNTIHTLLRENDVDLATDKLMFVGFSQGSIMALDALVSQRFPLAGIIAFSGRLASPQPYSTSHGEKALLVHGKSDPVIAWSESEKAGAHLKNVGFIVQAHYEEGVGHTITQTGASVASEFIQKAFE